MKEKTEDSYTNLINRFWQAISGYISDTLEIKHREVAPGVIESGSGLNRLLGKGYRINPNPTAESATADFAYDIAPLLNELDSQPKGRKSYNVFNSLTNDIHLITDTSPEGLKIRGLLLHYFKNLERIDQITREVVRESIGMYPERMEIVPEKFIRATLLKILMRVFFASNDLPEGTDETMKLFSSAVLRIPLALYPQLSFFSSEHRKAKQQYKKLCNEIMNNQVHLIFEKFQSESFNPDLKGENLFIDLIMLKAKENDPSLFKDKEKLKRYLKNLDEQEIIHYLDFMTSLPSLLILADNISTVLEGCLYKFSPAAVSVELQHSMLAAMREECNTMFHKTGNKLTRKELSQLKLLDGFYHRELNSNLSINMIARYTEKPVSLKNKKTSQEVRIPAHSTLIFTLGAAAKYEGRNQKHPSNFSVQGHRRKCPGSHVAEVIFKAVVAELLLGPRELFFDKNSFYLTEVVVFPQKFDELKVKRANCYKEDGKRDRLVKARNIGNVCLIIKRSDFLDYELEVTEFGLKIKEMHMFLSEEYAGKLSDLMEIDNVEVLKNKLFEMDESTSQIARLLEAQDIDPTTDYDFEL